MNKLIIKTKRVEFVEEKVIEIEDDLHYVFALNLKRIREEAGISMTHLAKDLGYGQPSVTGWERGNNFPSLPALIRVCHYFNVTPNDLLWDKDE